MYQDKTLICKDCGAEFVFSAGEQEFYSEKGFLNEPNRCRDCRHAKKLANRAKTVMYEIVCSQCGEVDKIPVEPRHDKPVFCKACFAKRQFNRD